MVHLRGRFTPLNIAVLPAYPDDLHSTGHPSIPGAYAWGRSQYAEYLALELLGPDIYTGTLDSPSGLTMRNLVALSCQMVRFRSYFAVDFSAHLTPSRRSTPFSTSTRTASSTATSSLAISYSTTTMQGGSSSSTSAWHSSFGIRRPSSTGLRVASPTSWAPGRTPA